MPKKALHRSDPPVHVPLQRPLVPSGRNLLCGKIRYDSHCQRKSWGNHITGDPINTQFSSEATGESHDARLRRYVASLVRRPFEKRAGAKANDPPLIYWLS
jgi:hypothetical protein